MTDNVEVAVDLEKPWDVIVCLGWGPEFAAGNVLKYLRRTKEPEHSLESARWYWQRLVDLAMEDRSARHVLVVLNLVLTDNEKMRLAKLLAK